MAGYGCVIRIAVRPRDRTRLRFSEQLRRTEEVAEGAAAQRHRGVLGDRCLSRRECSRACAAAARRSKHRAPATQQAGRDVSGREVDYPVATDAIGMGLLRTPPRDCKTSKFDGRHARRRVPGMGRSPAGRAAYEQRQLLHDHRDRRLPGRHRRGRRTTADPVEVLQWRRALDFSSVSGLMRSLEKARRTLADPHPRAEDHQALKALVKTRKSLGRLVKGSPATLWDVAQVLDFRKTLSDQHTQLLGQIYRYRCAGGRTGDLSRRRSPGWIICKGTSTRW